MRIGFTGSRFLAGRHLPAIHAALAELASAEQFTSGAARGVDTYVATWCAQNYSRAKHALIVPAEPHNDALVEAWMPNHLRTVRHMPEGTTYADRNRAIVAACDLLVAFPLLDEDRAPRSGTWQTVRMARKARVPVRCYVLDPAVDNGALQSSAPTVRRGNVPGRHTQGGLF